MPTGRPKSAVNPTSTPLPVQRYSAWVSPALAVLAGLLLPLSLAPFYFWPLGLLSVAGLYWVLEREPNRAVILGWCFGLGKYGLGASWVYVSIHDYGHAPVPLALFMVALFVGGMALFCLTQAWVYARLRAQGDHPRLANALLFVICWVVWEWFLTWVLTGFPWLFLGNAHLSSYLSGLAPVGGVLLVSASAALTAVLLTFCLLARGKRWWLLVVAVVPWLVGLTLQDRAWVDLGEPKTVALVQNNIDQHSKWAPEMRQPIVEDQLVLTRPHWGKSLIVWPEASVTYFEYQAELLLGDLAARASGSGSALVLGIPNMRWLPQDQFEFFNMAVVLGEGSGRYVKRHLVPFGEYVPLAGLLRGLVQFFDLPMSKTEPGAMQQDLLQIGDDLAAVAICYEIAYPGLVANHEGAANLLLTLSNDAWFGGSLGPHQHLQIAQMRALENGRYVLRATQSGITAIIDERGHIQGQLPQFEAAVLSGHYRPAVGTTPFVRWGIVPVVLFIVLLGLVVVSLRAPFFAQE